MESRELWVRLQADRVSATELSIVAMFHFTSGRHDGGDRIDYLKDDDAVALSFLYRRGVLAAIEAGPGLTGEDVDALSATIQDALVADVGTKVHRGILFSDAPVVGAWRYRDSF